MRMDTSALPRSFRHGFFRRQFLRRLSAPVAVVFAAMLAVVVPQACAACSCMPMTFTEATDRAEVIFVGTVTGRADGRESEFGRAVDVTFAVSDVYKGAAPAEAVVRTADNSAACGFAFEPGGTYLVMARSGSDGLETDLCTGTALAADVADGDLASLGAAGAPTPGTGSGSPSGGDQGSPAADGLGSPGRVWFIAGGAALGALLTGLVLWSQRRQGSGDPEIRRPSPGEALPHTEAT